MGERNTIISNKVMKDNNTHIEDEEKRKSKRRHVVHLLKEGGLIRMLSTLKL